MLQWRKESLNNLIEEAILDAEVRGVKVLSLGLLNQASKSSFLNPNNKNRNYTYLSQKYYLYPHHELLDPIGTIEKKNINKRKST